MSHFNIKCILCRIHHFFETNVVMLEASKVTVILFASTAISSPATTFFDAEVVYGINDCVGQFAKFNTAYRGLESVLITTITAFDVVSSLYAVIARFRVGVIVASTLKKPGRINREYCDMA